MGNADDNKYYYEVQRLSNEILIDKYLPSQNYSQSVVKVMQENTKESGKKNE